MTLIVKKVPIVTNGDGEASVTVRAGAVVCRAIDIALGTLTTPDIAITEEPSGAELLSLTALATDKRVNLQVPAQGTDGEDIAVDVDFDGGSSSVGSYVAPAVLVRMQIEVTGGGDTKTGEITFLLER